MEKESAEQKRLLHLLKKKAVKVAKKEADKDGRDEAEEEEEEDVDISKVGVLTSATGKNGNKCLIDFPNCYIHFFLKFLNFRLPSPRRRCRKKRNKRWLYKCGIEDAMLKAIIIETISTTRVCQTRTNQNMLMPPRTAFLKYVSLI